MSIPSVEKKSNLAHAAIRGTSWTYIAFYSGKLMVFLSMIVLARLLTKDDFGVVGYALAILGFLDVVKDLGISASIIYYKDKQVAETAFWLSLGTGITLYALVWILAPLISLYFNDPRAQDVTRVLALSFPLNALGSTHEALLIRDLQFGKKFIPDISRAVTKGIISISLAFLGFGPWSLIYSQLIGVFISVIVLWMLVPWRPSLTFDTSAARALLIFGLPIVGMNVISAFALNVDYLLVGRYLGSESLGIYTLAFRIPELTILQFCVIVAQVIFPVFNKMREDVDALKVGFLETARYVALITVPIGLGMAVLAEPFILAFFGEKWLDSVPVMRAIAIYSLLISLGYNAGDVYKAQGRPGMLTKISILHIFLLIPGLLWAVLLPASVVMVGWVQASVAFLISLVYLLVAVKMLDLSLMELVNSLKSPIMPGIGLTAAVIGVLNLTSGSSPWVQLAAGIPVGALAYFGILFLLERPLVNNTMHLVRAVVASRSE